MTKRVVEIGTEGCYLKLRYQQLVIEHADESLGSVPIEDMSALILDHPRSTITQSCLSALLDANVMVITSDARHQPVGMFLPLQSHVVQTERFNAQMEMGVATKKNLWKQIVCAKVLMQAKVLGDLTGADAGISALVGKIRSGDPVNIEAQAARRYWGRLFENFKRDFEADDQNRFLNYGYAIVRAVVSRSLCAAGLHPTIGLHHHNRYNAYCLADDLMEPYRPFVDLLVWEMVEEGEAGADMDQRTRARLLEILTREVRIGEETYTFQGAVQKSAQSLAKIVMGEGKLLALPSA